MCHQQAKRHLSVFWLYKPFVIKFGTFQKKYHLSIYSKIGYILLSKTPDNVSCKKKCFKQVEKRNHFHRIYAFLKGENLGRFETYLKAHVYIWRLLKPIYQYYRSNDPKVICNFHQMLCLNLCTVLCCWRILFMVRHMFLQWNGTIIVKQGICTLR